MRQNLLLLMAALALSASAQDVKAPPHSLSGDVDYSNVILSWKSPVEPNTLQWHNDESYNGISGIQTDPQGPCIIYGANVFSPSDLVGAVGKKVVSIAYNEYRNVDDVTIMIYEDGKPVYSQPVDVVNWVKDEMRNVTLTTPYVIPENKEIMFVVKKVHGYNQDFALICDRAATTGKGNVYSYDGETWYSNGPGDFLITAYIENNGNVAPDSYNVYLDGQKVNNSGVKRTEYPFRDLSQGEHLFAVSAVYDSEEVKSYELPLSTIDITGLTAPVVGLTGSVKDLTGTLSWRAPLLYSNELSWSGKEFGLGIGGTAATNTKVWIKQEFDSDELYFGSYIGTKINAINSYIVENSITGVTAFILKDGAIVYSEVMPDDVIAGIQAGAWNKFPLKEGFLLEEGHQYGFGLYYLQKPSTHPVGVDNQMAVGSKANSFSTSSPATEFNNSNPSWRTLASGDIAGNFMLSADIDLNGTTPVASETKNYVVYKNGQKLNETTQTSYVDEVEDLGKVTYSVVAVSADGKNSLEKSINLNYTLPAAYVTPTILGSGFDSKTGEFDLSWSANAVELRHYKTPSYIVGFDEEMDMMWGAQFPKEDLVNYGGYKLKSLTFAIGDDNLGDFNLLVMAGKKVIYEMPIAAGSIDAGYLYTLQVDKDVVVPEGEDLYLAYSAVAPGDTNPILLDGGPGVTGGAKISFTAGNTWMNLSALNPAYAGYNIVIGAVIVPEEESELTDAKGVALTSNGNFEILPGHSVILSAEEARAISVEEGIEAKGMKTRAASTGAPKADHFKVIRNGEVIAEIKDTKFSEKLEDYGFFTYNVKTVFTNGWESAASKDVNVHYSIPQKTQAPYNLKGDLDDKGLHLEWESIDAPAAVMKYHNEETINMALGMTGSGTREGYMAIKFTADDLNKQGQVGNFISHIKFQLNSTQLNTAAVFVMINEDVMYEQKVAVSDLDSATWNVIRLDRPFEVPAGKDVLVGYHLTYPNGVKPLMMDNGPAVVGKGDLISSSATSGYWYSLKEKYNMNMNYRMEAVFKTPDVTIQTRGGDASDISYIVRRDGALVADNITDKKYDVVNPQYGRYTVSAVIGDDESAESNYIEYADPTGGVDGIIAESGKAYFDKLSKTVVLPAAENANIYNTAGALVERQIRTDKVDLSSLPGGVYIVTTDSGLKLKVIL